MAQFVASLVLQMKDMFSPHQQKFSAGIAKMKGGLKELGNSDGMLRITTDISLAATQLGQLNATLQAAFNMPPAVSKMFCLLANLSSRLLLLCSVGLLLHSTGNPALLFSVGLSDTTLHPLESVYIAAPAGGDDV